MIFRFTQLDKIFANLYFIGLRERLSKIYTAFSQMEHKNRLRVMGKNAWLLQRKSDTAKGGNPPSRANCERSVQRVYGY